MRWDGLRGRALRLGSASRAVLRVPREAIMAGSQAKGTRTLVVRCGARDWVGIEAAESAGFPCRGVEFRGNFKAVGSHLVTQTLRK
jgi:hypothetical protein